jgi:hypothetical protein
MDIDDTIEFADGPVEFGGLGAARRGLQEHPTTVAQETVAGPGHQACDDEGGDGVGLPEAGEPDEQPGDAGDDEGEQVVEDVLEGPLDVETAAVGAAEQPGGADVDDDADTSSDGDEGTVDRRRGDEPRDGFVYEVDDQKRQGDAVGLG